MIITDDFSAFSNRWGEVDETPGQITVETVAGQWLDGGAMFEGPGFGYGLFEFDIALRSEIVGPHVTLWPASGVTVYDDVWPGPEVNVMEVHSTPGAGTYSTVHWDADLTRNVNEDDRALVFQQPDLDATVLRTYSVEWSPASATNPDGALWYAVNGVPYASDTLHVPRAAEDGGVNLLPGIGIHLWPSIMDQQTGGNAITLTEFRFSAWTR